MKHRLMMGGLLLIALGYWGLAHPEGPWHRHFRRPVLHAPMDSHAIPMPPGHRDRG